MSIKRQTLDYLFDNQAFVVKKEKNTEGGSLCIFFPPPPKEKRAKQTDQTQRE